MNYDILLEQLKDFEGLELKAYQCTAGKTTIGLGRNLDDYGITEEEAYYLAKNNIYELEDELDRAISWWRQLDDARQRALINLAYNVGTTTLLKFKKTLQYLEDGSYEEAAKEVLDSRWADQVGRRAIFISNVFLTGEEE
jgi:lysozyme